jgi:hypothetical protein
VALLRRRRAADAADRKRRLTALRRAKERPLRGKPLNGSRTQGRAPVPAPPPGNPPAFAFAPFGVAAGGAFQVQNPLAQK